MGFGAANIQSQKERLMKMVKTESNLIKAVLFFVEKRCRNSSVSVLICQKMAQKLATKL